ncbi:MAG TPA: MerR family transcriptional regulator [Thermodesulfobacteriota bacterium]|nr:MerR family transcriptional regulator [Thermodesulfobacteriota bacterium]
MPHIPDRLYFKIGEVARITRVKPYILRYWESEFKIISPVKSQGNQRVYKKKDVELILYIRKLLYEDKFTLEGAKKKAAEFKKNHSKQLNFPFSDKKYQGALREIRRDLVSLKNMLSAGRGR